VKETGERDGNTTTESDKLRERERETERERGGGIPLYYNQRRVDSCHQKSS